MSFYLNAEGVTPGAGRGFNGLVGKVDRRSLHTQEGMERLMMKRFFAAIMSVAVFAALAPVAGAQSCPAEVGQAKTMLQKASAATQQAARGQDVQAPRSLAGARQQDTQAPRSSTQDVQAPRSSTQDVQAPRSSTQDVQAPRSLAGARSSTQTVQASRSSTQDVQAPRSSTQDVQAPRSLAHAVRTTQNVQASTRLTH